MAKLLPGGAVAQELPGIHGNTRALIYDPGMDLGLRSGSLDLLRGWWL